MICVGCGVLECEGCCKGCPECCDHEVVTTMIEMPQGYAKPGLTSCRKCGAPAPLPQFSAGVDHGRMDRQSLTRYEREVENRQGGHYGEEQWTEVVMRPCETGAWVQFSDIESLFDRERFNA